MFPTSWTPLLCLSNTFIFIFSPSPSLCCSGDQDSPVPDMTGAGSGEWRFRLCVLQIKAVMCQIRKYYTCIINNLCLLLSCIFRGPGPAWRDGHWGGGEVSYLSGRPGRRRARHARQLLPRLLSQMPPHVGRGNAPCCYIKFPVVYLLTYVLLILVC